jgi:exodeoxyribonuclease-3
MKIATWNVNSIRKRMPALLAWLDSAKPDIVLLQELKCTAEQFPRAELEKHGWRLEVVGQKAYNGVAILSRHEFETAVRCVSTDVVDEQARYVEACWRTSSGLLRVASIYLPNGNPVGTEKFTYKLAFIERLHRRAAELAESDDIVVLGGDYNVCPTAADLYDPVGWANDALFRPETRLAFRSILNLGYTEAWRALHPDETGYSFWDYQGGAWDRDRGLRIDHLLLSPQAADRLRSCAIDRSERGRTEPSDHVPVWCELEVEPPT